MKEKVFMYRQSKIHPVSTLIFKEMIGKASPEEIEEINRWRNENPQNEFSYQQIHDNERLQKEYKLYRMIDSQSAMINMKALISREKRIRLKSILPKISAAAAVLVFAFLGVMYLNGAFDKYLGKRAFIAEQQIRHGEVKAILTLGNGKTVALDASQATISDESVVISKDYNGSLTYSEENQDKVHKLKYNDLDIPRGGEFSLILEDGTKVWLNSETKLRYPVSFVGDERRVFLEGEAYFKVAKGSKPFYVEAQGQIIKVYGTEFNVSAYSSDKIVYTTLVEGHVSVRAANCDSVVNLVPGLQSMFNKNSLDIDLRQVDTEEVTSWRTGMIVFEYQTFDQIMQKLARWYNFDYKYEGKDVCGLQYKGKAPRYGDFNDVLEVLEKCGGIKFKVSGKMVTIIGI
jgi:ferric-dicitrate binding protein FerR (iron transport regulator)